MIKNVNVSKRFLSMLAGMVIGFTPVATNAENNNTSTFTLVKQGMKSEDTTLNLERYTKGIETSYNYLRQFIDYDYMQYDLQCLYYLTNKTYMTNEFETDLVNNDIVYITDLENEEGLNNFKAAFRLIKKIHEYNTTTIKNDYENNTMDITHLINISVLCYDNHDKNLINSMFENYFNAYKNGLFSVENKDYEAVFKQLTTLNAYENNGNAFELSTGAMWVVQNSLGQEVMKMLEVDMLKDYSIEELSKYFVMEDLLNNKFTLRDDFSLNLNCLNELEYEVFNYGELYKFNVEDSNNNLFKLFGKIVINNDSEVTNKNSVSESIDSIDIYTADIERIKATLVNYIDYNNYPGDLQKDLQCLYYLTNKDYITDEVNTALINNGIIYETNFESEEGLINFMQAYSIINVISDYNQSVIRNDYENGCMNIDRLIDVSIFCHNEEDRKIVHEMFVNYFNAYKAGRFENQEYLKVFKEIIVKENTDKLAVGPLWMAQNTIGGGVMQMLRDDMQEDFPRSELDKYFVKKELNKGQWILREDVCFDINSTDELLREVSNFKELWSYVYDNVNNDLFALFQVDCKTR